MSKLTRANTLILALLLMMMLVASATVTAEEKKTIFYNLTTDEAWVAGMALNQASKAQEHGYKVVIFLNVRGVLLASKAFHSDSFVSGAISLQGMMKSAMKEGAKVIICPMCMKKVGLDEADLIEGVIMGGPDVTFKAMTADDTVVISY